MPNRLARYPWLAGAFIIVSSILGLSACGAAPEGAPPSAKQPVEPTVEGLVALFTRECVEQRDIDWIHEESVRIRATCRDFLTGEGEAGDCEQSVSGSVVWSVPTTRAGSTVVIEAIWDPNNDGKTICTLSTSTELSDHIAQVAQRIAVANAMGSPERTQYGEDVWRGQDGQVRLIIPHAPDAGSGTSVAGISFDTKGQWEARSIALLRGHPVQLTYRPAFYARGVFQ